MGKYADLSDLVARAGADDLARAASRDGAPVTGALLRRALTEDQPLTDASLDALRAETDLVIYAGASPAPAFTAVAFTNPSTTGAVKAPDYTVPSYVAVAIPESQPDLTSISPGFGNQITAFDGPRAVEIDGKPYKYWRTLGAWSRRSSGRLLTVSPLAEGTRLWQAAAVDALRTVLGRLNDALADADAEIDGRIRARYPAATALGAPVLTARACDVAAYEVIGGPPDGELTRRWKAALAFLRDVATGATQLDAPAPPAPGARIVPAQCDVPLAAL